MQIHRPGADIATTRKGHFRMFIFAKERTDQVVRSADLTDGVIVDADTAHRGAVDTYRVTILTIHHSTDPGDRLQHNADVAYVRKIVDDHRLIRHDRSRENSKRRILCAADLHLSHKRYAAFDYILLTHNPPQKGCMPSISI